MAAARPNARKHHRPLEDPGLRDILARMLASTRPAIVVALVAALIVAIGLPACGPELRRPAIEAAAVDRETERQMEMAMELWFHRKERLQRVAWRLATRGAPLCDKTVEPGFGLGWISSDSLPERFRGVARKSFGIDSKLRVHGIVPGSPAARAGLEDGDEIVSVGGHAVASLEDMARVWSGLSGNRVSLTVLTVGGKSRVELKGVERCAYPVRLDLSDAINAFADGKAVGITTGMMRFVESDDELALVVGHELAHNVSGHVAKQQTNTLAGFFLGALVDAGATAAGVDTGGAGRELGARMGQGAYSKDFESEADYLGCYFAARAGYDASLAMLMWRRMAAEHPASISGGGFLASHPATAERAVALERTVEEIRLKQARGRELVPERLAGG